MEPATGFEPSQVPSVLRTVFCSRRASQRHQQTSFKDLPALVLLWAFQCKAANKWGRDISIISRYSRWRGECSWIVKELSDLARSVLVGFRTSLRLRRAFLSRLITPMPDVPPPKSEFSFGFERQKGTASFWSHSLFVCLSWFVSLKL
jgi:hypothetical protein